MSLLDLIGVGTIGNKPRQKKVPKNKPKKPEGKDSKITSLPPGRVSTPVTGDSSILTAMGNIEIIKPSVSFKAIPVIRTLYKINEDIGSVLNDLVQLTNTGHVIKFDQTVDPTLADDMRRHLELKGQRWGYGLAGINGLINKFITQIWVGGALSIEAYPDNRLTEISNVAIINPETIRFKRGRGGEYIPLQKTKHLHGYKNEYKELNPKTYLYLSLIGDEDTPYGVPPFLTALSSIRTQKDMKENINHILNQLGLLGYLEVRVEKPYQEANEHVGKYRDRLSDLLRKTKQNIIQGFKEGVVTGFKDDHEFEFHSTTKNLNGVRDIFDLNEVQIANGLKTHPSFLNVESKGGEGVMSIVFTKMLSQLKNVQTILIYALTHIYTLELTLAGYDFKGLEVEFRPSTITDDLKLWQAREIKQRVLHNLWVDRIISSELYAEEMDYQKPYKNIEPPQPGTDTKDSSEKKEKREKDKDTSDRRVRDKNKPQPKRKDGNTKPV